MASWRLDTFPISQPRTLREHVGMSITPHVRPGIIERVPGGYTADKVALPAPHN